MRETRTVRLATRGSDLALRQAAAVAERLEDRRTEVELVEVETEGDRIRDELIHRLGKTGAFVRALDERVLEGEVDAAVHSMKDVPTDFPEDLVVAGVPERAPAGDLLLTPGGRTLEELPEGATVGTSSLRRQAQLLAERPDLDVRPLRGNVDTRVEKLFATSVGEEHERRVTAAEEDDPDETFEESTDEWFDSLSEIERQALSRYPVDTAYDAIVLAEAGLERMGLLDHVPHQRFEPTRFVPAPGQGAVAVTALSDAAEPLREALDHPRTRVETTVERTVLEELGGGCVAPLGVHATLRGEYVHAVARVLGRDGEESIRDTRDLPARDYAEAAREFAADLADRGAAELVAAARKTAAEHEETEGPR
ncbi:MAG: hydroxymethylbilane synthase [Haloglomus sp.]